MTAELNILNQKLELIQWLSTIEDSAIIEKIEILRKKERTDWWDKISKKEKDSIALGLKDADSKKLIPQAKVRKQYEKWL